MIRGKPQDTRGEHPWSVPVAVANVPETGLHVGLAAADRIRSSVAKLAGLRSLPRLEVTFDLIPHGRDGVHVVGRLSATVGQTCVVSLDPMETEVEEDIDLIFAPQAPMLVDEGGETIEIIAENGIEPLTGGTVDLGSLATEFLILGIDPYPRKPDAVFDPPATSDGSAGPFAALAAIKGGDKAGNG